MSTGDIEAVREVARAALADPGNRTWASAAELGWTGIIVPEEHGGAEAGFAMLAVVLSELGRVLAPGSLPLSATTATACLINGASRSAAEHWLPRLASGDKLLACALGKPPVQGFQPDFEVAERDGGYVLHGEASFIPDAGDADAIILAARHHSTNAPLLVLVGVDSPGIETSLLDTVDQSRRFFRLGAREVVLSRSAIIAEQTEALRAKLAGSVHASMSLACDSLGIAQAALDMTVEHVKTRVQFGRPIGSFQAVKHGCTDMLTSTEASRVLVAEAARRLPGLDPAAHRLAWMAKAAVCDAASQVCAAAVQLHGGIGFTWEHGLHRYLKRAKLNQVMLADPASYRAAVFDSLTADAAAG
jgi:alkylation response protein AidB-like acyl-CoA dehydrogenase